MTRNIEVWGRGGLSLNFRGGWGSKGYSTSKRRVVPRYSEGRGKQDKDSELAALDISLHYGKLCVATLGVDWL